jgi:hypothetical protein
MISKQLTSYKDYDWLYNQYIILQLSSVTIAKDMNVSSDTIYNWLKKYNIIRRNRSEAGKTSEMKIVKSSPRGHIYQNKEWLIERYIVEQKSVSEISLEAETCFATIEKWIHYYNIPYRNHKESHGTIRYRNKKSGENSSSKRPEVRKKIQIATIKHFEDDNTRLLISERQKVLWQNDEYRNKQICARKGLCKGSKNPNWQGGKSFEPYCPKFDESFKNYIRNKFGQKCFLCNTSKNENNKNLHIHHIDYDKLDICNGKEWPFVPLCNKCHSKTNFNRHYWFNLLINYWTLNENIRLDNLNKDVFIW